MHFLYISNEIKGENRVFWRVMSEFSIGLTEENFALHQGGRKNSFSFQPLALKGVNYIFYPLFRKVFVNFYFHHKFNEGDLQ